MNTWILVANATEAKIFESPSVRTGKLELLRELSHAENRQKIADFVSDRPGRYKNDQRSGSAYEEANPKEIAAERFATTLAHELKLGKATNLYQQLIIITPAHFYGLLEKHFPEGLETSHIAKDYTKYDLPGLAARLKEHVFP